MGNKKGGMRPCKYAPRAPDTFVLIKLHSF